MSLADLIGKRIDRLFVTDKTLRDKFKSLRIECTCDCGGTIAATPFQLRNGLVKSCGCLRKEGAQVIVKHGASRVGMHTPEYSVWEGIKRRCLIPSEESYPRYGGRGITICDRWRHDFTAFLADVGHRPTSRHSIERKDNNGNYEPTNCFWATAKQQARNRVSTRYVDFDGDRISLAELAERVNIGYWTLRYRIDRGMSATEAVAKGKP